MELRALSHLLAAHLIAPSLRGNRQGSLAERRMMLRHRVLMQRHGITGTEGDP